MTHILIVSSPYYKDISDALMAGATAACAEAGATYDVIEVPGAFEIPAAISLALDDDKYDGFIALGCVIRGETTHYDIIANESARGLMDLAIHDDACIGNGILTVENYEQAQVRADVKHGNKGADAALACMRLIEIKKQFSS
ncbi:MAG: 6,7-dimethyl-8-ribityllumazine synthase [Alphaproteobacteria bacterium]